MKQMQLLLLCYYYRGRNVCMLCAIIKYYDGARELNPLTVVEPK